MKNFTIIRTAVLLLAAFYILVITPGCKIYSFNDVGTIDEGARTARVQMLENRAQYVNPQLSPQLTDRLKQKITNQTRLASTSSDNAHYDISGYISQYNVTTAGVSSDQGRQQTSINRLNVTVHIVLNRQLVNKTEEFDISRSFDFGANQSLQSAEANLLDEMIKNLTDEIFNRIFSNW